MAIVVIDEIQPKNDAFTGLIDADQIKAVGTLLDGTVAESNVTQHEAAIDHNALTNFVTNKHIDWTAASAGTIHASNYVDNNTNTQNFITKTITVEDPTSSEDITIFFTPVAITMIEMRAVLLGSSSPSVTWRIRHRNDRSEVGDLIITAGTTTTSISTGSDLNAPFDDGSIPADSFVWLETTAKSGTVTELNITLVFSEA